MLPPTNNAIKSSPNKHLTLSPKQTHRLYGYYYLGLSMQDIANKEGVSVGSVSECIKSALTALRERCNLFNF